MGQDENYPATDFDAWNLNNPINTHVNVQGDHASLIRTIGAASTVLLKNVRGVLPLHAPQSLAIIGKLTYSLLSLPCLIFKYYR